MPKPHRVGKAMRAATRTTVDPDFTLEGFALLIQEAPKKESTRMTAARATQIRMTTDHSRQAILLTPSHQSPQSHGKDPPRKARRSPIPIAATVWSAAPAIERAKATVGLSSAVNVSSPVCLGDLLLQPLSVSHRLARWVSSSALSVSENRSIDWVGCTTVRGVVLLLFQRDLSFSSPGSREEVMDPYRAFPRAGRSFQPIPTGLRRLAPRHHHLLRGGLVSAALPRFSPCTLTVPHFFGEGRNFLGSTP